MQPEQAKAQKKNQVGFAAMLRSIKKVGLKLDGINSVYLLEKNRNTKTAKAQTDTMVATDEVKALCKTERTARNEFGEFDPDDVYHTFIDPFPRTRQKKG